MSDSRHDLSLALVGARQVDEDVLADRHRFEKTFELAVFGDIDDAVAAPPRAACDNAPARLELDAAAVEEIALEDACDDLRRLGPARPRPGQKFR